jgi:23S rRNA (cytidine1920-2'-O)/16S rRNA (cytidine1409-2'-O)-methyltransferase
LSDRIDKMMVKLELVKTRSQARMLITQGDVYHNNQLVKKPGLIVSEDSTIEIRNRSLFVSRGAYKLEKALNEFQVEPKGKICADCGASTGGFTQLLVQRGAKKIYAIDVGHGQLADELKDLPHVINMEGVNLKYPLDIEDRLELVVMDLSFISITKVLENITRLLSDEAELIILIKPQFEVGKEKLTKQATVKPEDRIRILQDLREFVSNRKLRLISEMESPIRGNKSGNIEYLWHLCFSKG